MCSDCYRTICKIYRFDEHTFQNQALYFFHPLFLAQFYKPCYGDYPGLTCPVVPSSHPPPLFYTDEQYTSEHQANCKPAQYKRPVPGDYYGDPKTIDLDKEVRNDDDFSLHDYCDEHIDPEELGYNIDPEALGDNSFDPFTAGESYHRKKFVSSFLEGYPKTVVFRCCKVHRVSIYTADGEQEHQCWFHPTYTVDNSVPVNPDIAYIFERITREDGSTGRNYIKDPLELDDQDMSTEDWKKYEQILHDFNDLKKKHPIYAGEGFDFAPIRFVEQPIPVLPDPRRNHYSFGFEELREIFSSP